MAANIISSINGRDLRQDTMATVHCPLTVEHGKIVLAEFGYGGKLLPSFPSFLLNGTRPTWAAWILKKDMLPRSLLACDVKGSRVAQHQET